jgi:hypothetical protein
VWACWIVVLTGLASSETTVTTHFPVHDTYVRGGSDADTNYDSDSKLRVKNASGESNDRQTLVRFDLSGTSSTLISATLNLYCVGLTNGTPSAAFAYSVADDTWQEDTVTWNTAPAAVTLLDSRTDIITVGATYSFDVTAFVAQEMVGDGMVSLLLRDDIEVKKAADFDRREGSNPPTLVIETQNQFVLAVTPSGSGQVTLAPPGGAYDAGTQVVLTAVPDFGWQFISWSGDLSGSVNPTSVTMDADKSVVALFLRSGDRRDAHGCAGAKLELRWLERRPGGDREPERPPHGRRSQRGSELHAGTSRCRPDRLPGGQDGWGLELGKRVDDERASGRER